MGRYTLDGTIEKEVGYGSLTSGKIDRFRAREDWDGVELASTGSLKRLGPPAVRVHFLDIRRLLRNSVAR